MLPQASQTSTDILMREDVFLSEARRLGEDDEKIARLRQLQEAQTPLLPKEERATRRARALVLGRGWPTERIWVFFTEGDESALPGVVGPTAVVVPREFATTLNESELVRVILHEMVHARSMGLPAGSLPDGWYEDIGLYQLREGLVEMIAERIMRLPVSEDNQLLHQTRQKTHELCRRAGLDLDAVERLSAEEAIRTIATSTDMSLGEISEWICQETGISRV